MSNILQQVTQIADKTLLETILIKEVVAPICIIAGAFIIYMISKKIIKDVFRKKNKRYEKRKHETIISILNNLVKYVLIIITILMLLNVYGINTSAILASLGIVSVILGLALQDTLKDILAGMSIIFESQFAIGDNIEVGNFRGEVVSMGLKTTKIRAYTGEIRIVANRNITEVTNYSLASSLAIVDIGVPYDANIEKIEKVLNDLCLKLNDTLPNLVGKVSLLGINELADSAIIYRMTAETKPMQYYIVEREMRKQIKITLDKNKIDIPFPQMVVHNG